MFARIFMFVLFRLYMYDMDNVYVCIVLTKWSNKNKFFLNSSQLSLYPMSPKDNPNLIRLNNIQNKINYISHFNL